MANNLPVKATGKITLNAAGTSYEVLANGQKKITVTVFTGAATCTVHVEIDNFDERNVVFCMLQDKGTLLVDQFGLDVQPGFFDCFFSLGAGNGRILSWLVQSVPPLLDVETFPTTVLP